MSLPPIKRRRRESSSSDSSDSDSNAHVEKVVDVGFLSLPLEAGDEYVPGCNLDVGALQPQPVLDVGALQPQPVLEVCHEVPTASKCIGSSLSPAVAHTSSDTSGTELQTQWLQPGPSQTDVVDMITQSPHESGLLLGRDDMNFDNPSSSCITTGLDKLFIGADIPVRSAWESDHSSADEGAPSDFTVVSEVSDASEDSSDEDGPTSDCEDPVPINVDTEYHQAEAGVDRGNIGGIIPEVDPYLFKGCPITTEESLISILAFAESEKLSRVGLSRLLKLVEIHCPKPNNCPPSIDNITDHFKQMKIPIKSYFYCNLCLKDRVSLTDICDADTCKNLGPSVDQVLVLPLVEQVSKLYERPGFLNDIQYRFTRTKLNPENLEDIYDGKVYKNEEQDILKDIYNTSFMWSSDGFSPFDSADQEVWPFYLNCNELPPKKRFLRENLVLAAVYVGKSKPHPNVFLQHVYENVQSLREGFSVKVPDQLEPLHVKACVICGTCDSPAKALLFNQKHFNGFYSCPKCLCKGEKSEESEDVFVHPFEEDIVMRTESHYEECAQEATLFNFNRPKTSRISPYGIKGSSFLYLIVSSMIFSTAIDTMHCVYLGIMDKFLDLWFSKIYRKEPWSLYSAKKVVNSVLLSIHPPHFIKRMPRRLEQKAKFKAYELLVMMYYYLLPALERIMKQAYFHNFKLLVAGMSIFNKSSISKDNITLGRGLLNQFCRDFQELYGLRHMSFNMHLVRHMDSVVENLGPACFSSCFGMEDLNGKMCSLIHGNRYVGSQLYTALFTFLHLPRLVYYLHAGVVKDYCKSLSKKYKKVSIKEKIVNSFFSVGKYTKVDNIPVWMLGSLGGQAFQTVFTFKRVLIHGHVMTSETYCRSKKNRSDHVKYSVDTEQRYGRVKMYAKLTNCSCVKHCLCPGTFFAFIKTFETQVAFETANPYSRIDHIVKFAETETIEAVPVSSILNVCFKVCQYLCDPLNEIEMYN